MRQCAANEWEQVWEKEKKDVAPSADPGDRSRVKPTFTGFAKGAFTSWFSRVTQALGSGD